jgi:Zn finger protein HypA/HybF involved in hydrogenase expression
MSKNKKVKAKCVRCEDVSELFDGMCETCIGQIVKIEQFKGFYLDKRISALEKRLDELEAGDATDAN